MRTAIVYLGYLVALGELWLAIYFLRTHSGHVVRKAMAALALSTGLWVLSTTVAMYAASTPLADVAVRLTYVFGVMMVTSVFLFALLYPIPSLTFDRWHIFLLIIPIGIFTVLFFGSNIIIESYFSSSIVQGQWFGGNLYNLYNAYLILLYSLSIILLLSKRNRVDGVTRRNATLVFWSLFLGGMPGVINDLFIPFFTNSAKNPAIGTLSTVIWLGTTSYIVLKK